MAPNAAALKARAPAITPENAGRRKSQLTYQRPPR